MLEKNGEYKLLKRLIDCGVCSKIYLSKETISRLNQSNLNQIQKYIKNNGIKVEDLVDIPVEYICKISYQLMQDPVVTEHGNTYDRKSIEEWFREHDTDPLYNLKVNTKVVYPINEFRTKIFDYLQTIKI